VVDACTASAVFFLTLFAPGASEAAIANPSQQNPPASAQQMAWQPARAAPAVPIPPDARVGEVSIEIVDVFDARVPAERGWAPGLANSLHVNTRESIVRRELLFGPGDPYDAERILQTERNLRALGIFRRVEVVALPSREGVVTVHVRVQDAWTLRLGGSFSRQGGVSTYDVRLGDANLAGQGVAAGLRYASGFERSEYDASLVQSRLFGTRERLAMGYADRSDGIVREASLSRPFFAVDTAWAHETSFRSWDERYRLYENGEVSHEYGLRAVDTTLALAGRLGSPRPNSAWRLGAGYRFTAREYTLLPGSTPADADLMPISHRWGGPSVSLQFVQHRFETRSNLISPDRDVDFNLGLQASLGLLVSALGTGPRTDSRVLANGSVAHGWRLGSSGLAMASAGVATESGGGQEARAEIAGTLRAWFPHSATDVRAVLLDVRLRLNPEPGICYYLGGSEGLWGFRERQFAGTTRVLLIGEERKYFGWRPWNLLQPGIAAFAEVGALWGAGQTFGTGAVHADVGGGLRVAVLKSARDLLLTLDVAVPLTRSPTGDQHPRLVAGLRREF
jgi:hypothetical protein